MSTKRSVRCPHCGNRNQAAIQDNGVSPRSVLYGLLCVARVAPGSDAFDGEANPPLEVDPDGKVACGMQWSPNEEA